MLAAGEGEEVGETVRERVVACDSDELAVAVTLIKYVPGDAFEVAVTFMIVVPGLDGVTMTLFALRTAVIPAGVVGVVKVTVPENPFKLDTVSVEVCDVPWSMVRAGGLGLVTKSGCPTMNLPFIGPLCMKHQYVYTPGVVVAVKVKLVPVVVVFESGSPEPIFPFPL